MTVRPTLPSVAARKRRPAPTAMLGSELERLHRHYSTTGDQAARAALVEAYAHLAGSLAARFQGRAQSPDDLLQAAMVGLLHALDRFDPDRGAEFTTFAWATISGELKRLLRDRSWALRLPRRLQESSLRTTAASAALTAELGRSPTVTELAERTGLRADDVIEALGARGAYRAASIDDVGGRADIGRLGGDDPAFEQVEGHEQARRLVATLTDRERQIINLRFVHNLTQGQIAARLGISQVHVSRLLERSLQRLRRRAAEG